MKELTNMLCGLKPCPFCGSEPEIREPSIVCSNEYCPAHGGSNQIPKDLATGKKWWNRRSGA